MKNIKKIFNVVLALLIVVVITITTVPFDDAIRYAKEQIEKLNEEKKNDLIFGGKKEDNLSIFTYKESKLIGYFVEEVNIKGDGDSYYRNK